MIQPLLQKTKAKKTTNDDNWLEILVTYYAN